MSGALPSFVEYPSDQTLPGPIQFDNATLWGFPLHATRASLRALCDSLIATPSRGEVEFVPISDYVIMTVVDFPLSHFVRDENRGTSKERELSFSIPGIFTRFAHGIPVQIGFALLMPFLFLDNPVAVMTGREEYGYFKQAGWIGLPTDQGTIGFTVDVFGCPAFSPTAIWQRQRLLTLDEPTPAPLPMELLVNGVSDIATGLTAIMREVADKGLLIGELFGHFLDGGISQIFLKQFRDIEDGTRACYQAVTLADYRITRLAGISAAGRYRMHLEGLQSTPVAEALGLVNPVETGVGMMVQMDMRLETGRVLWQA
jgi:hypothetical protein